MKHIALIEDDQLLLKRLALFLDSQPDYQCSLRANSLGSFFEQLSPDTPPDLLLMDVELSDTINTINHLKKIKTLIPGSKIIIVTGHNHPSYISQALNNGADGFYLKGSGLRKLLEAIEITFEGGAFLAPEAAIHVLPMLRNNPDNPKKEPSPEPLPMQEKKAMPSAINLLTARELEVARGLVKGASYKEIANDTNISINTVRHYVKVLYKKFDVTNKMQLSLKIKTYL